MAKPALEPAHPSGAVAGTYQPVDHALTEVLMDDGTWQHAEVMGEARATRGRWRVLLLWYGLDSKGHQSQFETWFMFDPEKLRRVTEDLRGG